MIKENAHETQQDTAIFPHIGPRIARRFTECGLEPRRLRANIGATLDSIFRRTQRGYCSASAEYRQRHLLIYDDEQGGEPLFSETQSIAVDASGRFKAQIGATLINGIPIDLFASGEARWLAVQVAGEPAQPRILLASVPYAMKAADADTLGGLPASAFALAGTENFAPAALTANVTPNADPPVTTTGGFSGYIPVFNSSSSIVNSTIFQNANGIGINGVAYAALDVSGRTIFRGTMVVSRNGDATATSGVGSVPLQFWANDWNSTIDGPVQPVMQLQAEPTGNNTASPGATLNLLYNNGTVLNASETGLYFNANGTIHFAPGQTFPIVGTGGGTITAVTAGTALTGGGTTGPVTLNVDTTKVPLLSSTNTFEASQALSTGDLSLGSTFNATTGVINIGGIPFLHGFSKGNQNVFVGNAGNFTTTGTANAATGFGALSSQTSGGLNTASGSGALLADTTGSGNTAAGADALASVTTGGSNTGVGVFAGPTSGTLSNTTAVGANAKVGQSNSLVLGNTNSTPGAKFVNVGIGTETPASILEASVNVSSALGPVLTLTNPGGATAHTSTNAGTAESIDFNSYIPSSSPEGNLPAARIEAVDNGFYSDNLIFSSKFASGESSFLQQNLTIQANGQVAVGLPTSGFLPTLSALLTVFDTGPTGWDGIDTTGGAEVGAGIFATGGDETASSSIQGGTGGNFVGGYSPGTTGDGIDATPGDASFSSGAGWAGLFIGDIDVTGVVFGSVKDFRIDHPLDPANKYFVHSSVESSEMMNIYSGNVVTDELGLATITLPDWFEAENADFRYQLTTIGRQAQAWIAEEVGNGQFKIATNASRVKVSWQITGVRQDAYAKANPLVVEQEKPANEKGFYIHPELFGQPAEKQTEWSRRPQQMQRMKAMREKQNLKAENTTAR